MSRKKRRTFSKEYMADALRLYRESGESLRAVSAKLGITENSLRRWVKQADIDAGNGPEGTLTTAEKDEVCQMKWEIKRLLANRLFFKGINILLHSRNTNTCGQRPPHLPGLINMTHQRETVSVHSA